MAKFPSSGVEPLPQTNGIWAGATNPGSADVYVDGQKMNAHSTATTGAYKAHGLTLTGDYQVSFWCEATDVIGDGGSSVYLLDGSFNGWMFFVGNAIHLYRVDAGALAGGSGGYFTNWGRTNTGPTFIECTFTRSTNLFKLYYDGTSVLQLEYTSALYNGGALMLVQNQMPNYPSGPANNVYGLVVQDFVTVVGTGPTGLTATVPTYPAARPTAQRTMMLR